MLRTRLAAEPRTLGAAYERCRQLHARHGRTYYLATLLLPRWKRRHVHALYGFARYADEIVDDLTSTLDGAGQAAALRVLGERFFAGLRGAPCEDPVFLWGIGLVLNAWEVYWHKPLSEDRIREEMERIQ